MIKEFIERYQEQKEQIIDYFIHNPPDNYFEFVKYIIQSISTGEWGSLDYEKITEINNGDWQGTLLYLIPAKTYQPYKYWYVRIFYGSCSGCDSLQYVLDDPEDKKEVYATLILHVIQELKELGE